jgi:hypothetical protein
VLGVSVGNSPDGVRLNLHHKMRIHDALPESIRQALASAPFDYNPIEVFIAWNNSGLTDLEFIEQDFSQVVARDLAARNCKL